MTPKALLVEDSPEFARLGARLLTAAGYEVVAAGDGPAAVRAARERRPDLILLDVSLPGIDGFEVCRQIRTFSDAYVIMVTGRDDEIDKIVGLTVGADDYVTKPYSARELTARIAAVSRRPRTPAEPDVLDFGVLRIDLAAREVALSGQPLALTRIEFDLLAFLAAAPKRSYSRDQLLDSVWGGDWYGDDHVIDVHVANLRRKLGENGQRPRFIHTVRGVGFRFLPPE